MLFECKQLAPYVIMLIFLTATSLYGLINSGEKYDYYIEHLQKNIDVLNSELAKANERIDSKTTSLRDDMASIDKRLVAIETSIRGIQANVQYIFTILAGFGSAGTVFTIYIGVKKKNAKNNCN